MSLLHFWVLAPAPQRSPSLPPLPPTAAAGVLALSGARPADLLRAAQRAAGVDQHRGVQHAAGAAPAVPRAWRLAAHNVSLWRWDAGVEMQPWSMATHPRAAEGALTVLLCCLPFGRQTFTKTTSDSSVPSSPAPPPATTLTEQQRTPAPAPPSAATPRLPRWHSRTSAAWTTCGTRRTRARRPSCQAS